MAAAGKTSSNWVLVAAIGLGAAAIFLIWTRRVLLEPVTLTGAVLRQDKDPKNQSPLANTKVTAIGGLTDATATSDASGLFKLAWRPGLQPGQPITLEFEHTGYKPLKITDVPLDRLCIARLEPLARLPAAGGQDHDESPPKPVLIKDVRVRYSFKDQTTINVGSVAKQFEVANIGNVACSGHVPCSPDGKWEAKVGSISLDAEKGNEFHNVRASCIAGPCPFTRIETPDLSHPGRKITISALDWSDTATFLVEAEVIRVTTTDTIRWSYPSINGQTMSFALPSGGEGPSIEADLNGEDIVFPLGPRLFLSWAACTTENAADHSTLYRCELKPGYQLQP